MRYLSVCSGIEAATVAWHHLGWMPVGFSEIEPFPSAVLAHHYPNVPNYGDMTKHQEWPLEPGSIDLLVGGTPCQSFSVAGLRKGLSDPRGGLMLTYLEIAQRLRPQWIVWENVPGVLSSGGGRDFGSFLGALGELGYGWAYRVLDAQWVRTHGHPRAVPQRRRRVFVVGCLGDWERAAAVLFERESVQRDSSARRASRKGTASDAEGCAATVSSKWSKGSGGYAGTTEHHNLIQVPEVSGTLDTECGSGKLSHQGAANGHLIPTSVWWDGSDCAGTLTKQNANGAQRMPDKDNFGAVLQPVGYRWQNDRDGLVEDGTAPACRASAGSSGFHEMNHPVVVQQPVPYDLFQITAPVNRQNRKPGDPCHTLARDNAAHAAVAVAQNQLGEVRTSDVSGTLNTNSNASGRNTAMAAVAHAFYSTGGTHGVNQHPEVSPAVKVGSGLGIPSPPAVAFANRTRDGIKVPEVMADGIVPALTNPGDGGRSDAINVAVESLQQQGYNGDHASTQEANAVATLRVLRDEIGAEAFTAWGLGVLDSLQPSQVLRSRLHGKGIRCASFSRSWPIDCAISRPEDRAAWAVQSVREAEGQGCSPSRRELPQQLAEQLGAYLSQLPCPGPQAERLMHHLWCASEGVGILRQALSEIQEARRPTTSENKSVLRTMCVRRLTATECEFLQGFPRNWTLIPWRGKAADQCPDGPRYKALGNSMAVNVVTWIGERIHALNCEHDQ